MADDSTLWVGGLADAVTEDHLYELFLQAGPLQKVTRPKERDGSSKKFAFVEFRHVESVPYAIQIMDGIKLFNQHLRLKGRTGSQHEGGQQESHSMSHSHNSSRGTPDYHHSRSYQGHGQQNSGFSRSISDDRRGGQHPLSQPFNNSFTYGASNMQPQSMEDRRNRLLNKQNMSLGHQVQRSGSHNQHRGHNYAQSFNNYGQQSGFQQQYQYYDNY